MLTFLKSIQHWEFYNTSKYISYTAFREKIINNYPNDVIIYGNKTGDPVNLIKSHLILDCSEQIKQLLIDW